MHPHDVDAPSLCLPSNQDRAEGCARYLTASLTCSDSRVLLTASDDGTGAHHWVLTGTAASPSPAPALPSPTPAPVPVTAPPCVAFVSMVCWVCSRNQ